MRCLLFAIVPFVPDELTRCGSDTRRLRRVVLQAAVRRLFQRSSPNKSFHAALYATISRAFSGR